MSCDQSLLVPEFMAICTEERCTLTDSSTCGCGEDSESSCFGCTSCCSCDSES